jgi:hypothetical protein
LSENKIPEPPYYIKPEDMKKHFLMMLFTLALSTSFVSCRETKDAAEATGEAVEEGVEEVGENTGIGGDDDL